MSPLGWVAALGFIAGALTFQVHFWASIRDSIPDEKK